MHLVQFGNLVEQLARLLRVRDPRRRTCQPSLEVVRPSTQELVANVQCFAALNPAKYPLTGKDTPGLIADVDEYVVSAVERAKGETLADLGYFLATSALQALHMVSNLRVSSARSKRSLPVSLGKTCARPLVQYQPLFPSGRHLPPCGSF